MTKITITDPEELREPTLPKGEYLATITNCYVDKGSWGDLGEVERVICAFTLAEHPDCDFAKGTSLSLTMPIAKGSSNMFLSFCRAFSTPPADFDSDDFVGQTVMLSVGSFIDKRTGDPRNAVNRVYPPPEGI